LHADIYHGWNCCKVDAFWVWTGARLAQLYSLFLMLTCARWNSLKIRLLTHMLDWLKLVLIYPFSVHILITKPACTNDRRSLKGADMTVLLSYILPCTYVVNMYLGKLIPVSVRIPVVWYHIHVACNNCSFTNGNKLMCV